jgi:hypothetical protein
MDSGWNWCSYFPCYVEFLECFCFLAWGGLARDLVFPGQAALGKPCLDDFEFLFLDLPDDFLGHWVLDRRHLGKFFLAEGFVGCLFTFGIFYLVIILIFLLPPVIRFVEEIAGSPCIPVEGDFLWAG